MLRTILGPLIFLLACAAFAFSAPIPPGPSGNYVNNSAAAQNAQFNVATGTVRGPLTVNTLNVSTLNIAGTISGAFSGSGAGLTGIPWAGVVKTGSNLSDLTTKDHAVLSSTGTNTHAQIDTHISGTAVHGATSANTASRMVARDASGNFSAGTVTANLTGDVAGNALTASTAASVAGGSAGTLLYQSAANTTAKLTAGTNNYVLQAHGAAAPSWTSSPTITGSNITGIPLAALNAGTLPTYVAASSITATGVTPGVYGLYNYVPQITIGRDGRITSAVMVGIPDVSTHTAFVDEINNWTKYQNFQSSIAVGSIYEDGYELLTAIKSTGAAVTVLQADLATEVSNRQIAVAAVAVSTGVNATNIASNYIELQSTGAALTAEIDRATGRENAIGVDTGTIAGNLASEIATRSAITDGFAASLSTAAYLPNRNNFTGLDNNFVSVTVSSLTVTGNAFSVGVSTLVVSGGKVGIGAAPSAVTGTFLTVKGSGNGTTLVGSWGASADYAAIGLSGSLATTGYNFVSSVDDKDLYINRPSGWEIFFTEANARQLTILTGGNVGIGTSAPESKLHVVGNIALDSAGIVKSSTTDGADSSYIYLTGGGSNGATRGGTIALGGNESAVPGQVFIDAGNVANGTINFRTGASASRMIILNNGNIGVGVTPTTLFQVNGGITASSFTATGNSAGLRIQYGTGSAPTAYAIKVSSANGEHIWGLHNNGHESIGGYASTIGTCANGAIVANSHDRAGAVELSGANSSCEIVFGRTMDAEPFCTLTLRTSSPGPMPVLSTASASGFTIAPNAGAFAAGDRINWGCPEAHE